MSQSTLEHARQLQADAAEVGFDWPGLDGIFQKLDEELVELREALDAGQPDSEIEAEFGDLFFVLINLARRIGLVPEQALASACGKFERRFGYVCAELYKAGRKPQDSSLEEMETLWQQAKQREKDSLR
jgi:uncharacterized protein YabN with tetrapyrrole methylase and pyrophosphatase domain